MIDAVQARATRRHLNDLLARAADNENAGSYIVAGGLYEEANEVELELLRAVAEVAASGHVLTRQIAEAATGTRPTVCRTRVGRAPFASAAGSGVVR